jgi:hypothetical protein
MASENSWYIENRVIYARLFGSVTQDDLREGNAAITGFIDTSGVPPIHIIFDTTAVERIMITALQVRNEVHYFQDKRIGWVVVCGLRGIVEVAVHFIGGIISRVTGIRIQAVSTLDDGLAFLRQVDPSLNDMKA